MQCLPINSLYLQSLIDIKGCGRKKEDGAPSLLRDYLRTFLSPRYRTLPYRTHLLVSYTSHTRIGIRASVFRPQPRM